MVLAVGTTQSVTITTHTARYTLHEAPLVDCNFYYEPGVRFQPSMFEVVWIDDDEPKSVDIAGRRTDNGHLTTMSYGIPQAPEWLFTLLQEHFADKNWKVLEKRNV